MRLRGPVWRRAPRSRRTSARSRRARPARPRERPWRPRSELEGESADSLHAEAFVALIERRWPAMEAAWRRAIELQPTHALALGSFGISPLHTPEARRGISIPGARPGGRSARLLSPDAHRMGAAVQRQAAGSPALRRGRALLRERGRLGPALREHGEDRPRAIRRRDRDCGAPGRGVAPRGRPLPRSSWGGRSRPQDGRAKPGRFSRSCEPSQRRPTSSRRPGCSARSGRSMRPSRRSREPRRSTRPCSTTRVCPASIRSAPTRDSRRCSRGWGWRSIRDSPGEPRVVPGNGSFPPHLTVRRRRE